MIPRKALVRRQPKLGQAAAAGAADGTGGTVAGLVAKPVVKGLLVILVFLAMIFSSLPSMLLENPKDMADNTNPQNKKEIQFALEFERGYGILSSNGNNIAVRFQASALENALITTDPEEL